MSEKGFLWDDVRMEDPDILLSIGTGRGQPAQTDSGLRLPARGIGRRGIFGNTWEYTAGLLENIFDCQTTWSTFLRESTGRRREVGNREYTSRYIRLNVDIPGVVPKLHMHEKMDELESLVRRTGVPSAKEVAHRLIASCFYLRLTSASPGQTCESGPEERISVEGEN